MTILAATFATHALTLRQPWASLVVEGLKPVENRTWKPSRTIRQWKRCNGCNERALELDDDPDCGRIVNDGPCPFTLAIHAGQRDDESAIAAWEALARARGVTSWLDGGMATLLATLPRGALLGTVDVVDVHHADDCAKPAVGFQCQGCGRNPCLCSRWAEPGVFHWVLDHPTALDEPIPMRGRQKLWPLPDHLVAAA